MNTFQLTSRRSQPRRRSRNTQPRRTRQSNQTNQRSLPNDAGIGHLYQPVSIGRTMVDLTGPWTIVPPEVRTVLPYHEELALSSGTYFADRVFSLNSLYDPDITSTGHQPMGFDQWQPFFNQYRVIQTGVVLRVNNSSSTSGLQVYMVVNDDPTPITSTPVAGESPYTKELNIGASTGVDVATQRAVYNLPQLVGRTLGQYRAEENYAGSFSGPPAQQWYLHVFFRTSDGSAVVDANYTIYLSYTAELFERRKLGVS